MSGALFSTGDYQKNRVWGGLGYIVFFLPLIFCSRDSRYGRYCANQGLIALVAILLVALAGWILNLILGWIPFLGTLFTWCVRLLRIAIGLIAAYYAYLAIAKNDVRALPYIGGYSLLR